MKKLQHLIVQNAHTITNLYNEVTIAAKNKNQDLKSWQKASQAFKERYDLLAFPGGWEQELANLKKGNPSAVAAAIVYLRVDPYFFRSGYIKEAIIRALKKVSLSKKEREELQDILLESLKHKRRREFREYCRLALQLADDAFVAKVQTLTKVSEQPAAENAQAMLAVLKNPISLSK